MLDLDNRTLQIVIGFMSIGSWLLLGFVWRQQRLKTGLRTWSLGMLTIALASFLSFAREDIPFLVLVYLTNMLNILGLLLILRGFRIFTKRPAFWAFDAVILLFSSVIFYYYEYIDNSLSQRIFYFSLIAAIISIATVITLLTDKNIIQRKASLSLAAGFSLFTLLNLCRGALEIFYPSKPAYFDGMLLSFFCLSTIFILGGIAITIVIQTYLVLESKLQLASLVVEHSASSIIVINKDGLIEYVNPATTLKTGYCKEELVGKPSTILRVDNDDISGSHDSANCYWGHLRSGQKWHGELHSTTKQGDGFWELASIAPVKQANGMVSHYVAVKEDITDLKEAKQHIQYLANHDTLTGLPTRALVMDRFAQAIEYTKNQNTKLAVLFLDLDGFKQINDTYGHAVGDKVLISSTTNLSQCVRDRDTVARIGGDEFLIIINHVVDVKAIKLVAKRMLKTIAKPYEVDGTTINISSSIGVSIYPDDSQDPDELIKLADQAMYDVKRNGKNNVGFASHL